MSITIYNGYNNITNKEIMMHKTYQETVKQYDALRKTYDLILKRKAEINDFYNKHKPEGIVYTGCGSGYCLCESARMSASIRLGIKSTAYASGDLMINHSAYSKTLKNSMLVVPSRSGKTTEVIDAVNKVRQSWNTPVLGIACTTGSELGEISDLLIELPWAFDESVCQTRTVSNLYIADLMLIAIWSDDNKLLDDIGKMIDGGEEYLQQYENRLKDIAKLEWSDVVILADGEVHGIAKEGAIAFTEIAKMAGRYYHVLDVRHGPMVITNEDSLVIVHINDSSNRAYQSLIKDLNARRAKVITFSADPESAFDGTLLDVVFSKKLDPAALAVPFINISQLLAYFKARTKGIDPDEPEGITAWVDLSKEE